MSSYIVEIRRPALEFIKKQAPKHQKQIRKKIDSLESDPHQHSAKRLDGGDGLWRVRTGDFRIIYTIQDEKLLVVIVTVGNRKDIHDRLKRAGLVD